MRLSWTFVGKGFTNIGSRDILYVGGAGMVVAEASGAIPRNDFKRLDEHAVRYYAEIRVRKSDVAAIARNTNFSINDVRLIKRHVFLAEHDLGKKKPTRFYPSYDMAVSWQRLIDGNDIREMDIVLLNHELAELRLMEKGLRYEEAHKLAEAEYNYNKYVKELDAREGII